MYTIQRSINETNTVSQALKHDLEVVRDHRQTNEMAIDYDDMISECLTKSDEIQ